MEKIKIRKIQQHERTQERLEIKKIKKDFRNTVTG